MVEQNKPKPAFFGYISIKYDEPDPSTYTAVKISTRDYHGDDVEEKTFATGDANYDYHCAMLWMETAGCESIMGSSSCDHFQMDGGVIDIGIPQLRERLKEYLETIEKPDKSTYIQTKYPDVLQTIFPASKRKTNFLVRSDDGKLIMRRDEVGDFLLIAHDQETFVEIPKNDAKDFALWILSSIE